MRACLSMGKQLNLLPSQYIESKESTSLFVQQTVLVVIGVIIFSLFNLVIILFSVSQRNTHDVLNAEISASIHSIDELRPIEARLLLLHQKLLQFDRMQMTRIDFDRMWQIINESSENVVEVTLLSYVPDDTRVQIDLHARSLTHAVAFLVLVDKAGFFEDLQVDSLVYDGTTKEYDISIFYVLKL